MSDTLLQQMKLNSKPKLKVKPKIVERKEELEWQEDYPYLDLAKKLLRMYLGVRKMFSRQSIPYQQLRNHPSFNHFLTLARHMEYLQQETKLRVDKAAYVYSHFAVFGKDTYPSHLIGGDSDLIYRRFKEQKDFMTVIDKPTFEAQKEFLEFLATTRDECPSTTLDKLRLSGLFTEDFIQQWGEVGGRKEVRLR